MLPLKLRALVAIDRHAVPALQNLISRLWRLRAYPKDVEEGRSPWFNEPTDPARVRRILVIRPGGIGDAVLSYPMIGALREHFRGARLDVLAEGRNAGIYAVNDRVDRVLCYDRLSGQGLPAVFRSSYDLVIDTEQYHRLSSLITFFSGARYRCGFDTLGRGRFLTHRVRYRETDYEVCSFLNLATAVTGRESAFDPGQSFLPVAAKWTGWAEETLFDKLEVPVVSIVPANASPTRVWPAERYRAVAKWLLEHGFAVCLLGGSECSAAASEIGRTLDPRRVFDLTARTNLAQSCAILKKSALYLGVDCGVLHMAVAVGVPTVHMFGSGIQEKWGPVGPDHRLIDRRLPCSPCTRHGYTPPCPYGSACMKAITVGEVIRAVGKALGGKITGGQHAV